MPWCFDQDHSDCTKMPPALFFTGETHLDYANQKSGHLSNLLKGLIEKGHSHFFSSHNNLRGRRNSSLGALLSLQLWEINNASIHGSVSLSSSALRVEWRHSWPPQIIKILSLVFSNEKAPQPPRRFLSDQPQSWVQPTSTVWGGRSYKGIIISKHCLAT